MTVRVTTWRTLTARVSFVLPSKLHAPGLMVALYGECSEWALSGVRMPAEKGLGGMRRRGVRADMGRTKGDGGGMVTRISVADAGAVFAASLDVEASLDLAPSVDLAESLEAEGDEACEVAGDAGFSVAAEEVEVKVVADEADEVREVGGLSSKVNLVLAPVGSGLMSTGERALRKST